MNLELTFTRSDFEEIEALGIELSDDSERDDFISAKDEVKEKLARVASGFYGSDRLAKDWANHLREIREKLKTLVDQTDFSCPKCGKRHRSARFTEEGFGDEYGRTFYYCSNRCISKH